MVYRFPLSIGGAPARDYAVKRPPAMKPGTKKVLGGDLSVDWTCVLFDRLKPTFGMAAIGARLVRAKAKFTTRSSTEHAVDHSEHERENVFLATEWLPESSGPSWKAN